MPDGAAAASAARNDRHGPGGPQSPPQRVGVVAAVGDQPADRPGRGGDDLGRASYVAGIARRETDGPRAAEEVGEDMDLGGAAASRDADRLCLRPPFPPWAERCAFT